jgi:hypothetical protein
VERADSHDADVMHLDAVAFEKCNWRKAAAEAGRRLLIEHADSLRADMMLTSALYCELELVAVQGPVTVPASHALNRASALSTSRRIASVREGRGSG